MSENARVILIAVVLLALGLALAAWPLQGDLLR